MRALRQLAPVLGLLVSCAPQHDVGSASEPIVNGEVHTGDPAVVAMTTGGQQYCTGTLVSKRHVITAAHCVPPFLDIPGVNGIEDIAIFIGPNLGAEGQFIPAAAVVSGPWGPNEISGDIAMVALERQAPVEPKALPTTWVPEVGESIRVVGYGMSIVSNVPGQGGSGIKRQGYSEIQFLGETGFDIGAGPSITCFGDSGGPAFAFEAGGREVVAGIHSRSDCEFSAYNELITPWMSSLITPFMQQNPEGTCAADDVCATDCPEGDPDCQCIEDGVCMDCERGWWWDPDCDLSCDADDICVESGCAFPDPDCGSCGNDGMCSPQCPDDPDCGECAADGVCTESCDLDPDCGPGANGGGGGCSTGSGAGGGLFWLLAMALVAVRRVRFSVARVRH